MPLEARLGAAPLLSVERRSQSRDSREKISFPVTLRRWAVAKGKATNVCQRGAVGVASPPSSSRWRWRCCTPRMQFRTTRRAGSRARTTTTALRTLPSRGAPSATCHRAKTRARAGLRSGAGRLSAPTTSTASRTQRARRATGSRRFACRSAARRAPVAKSVPRWDATRATAGGARSGAAGRIATGRACAGRTARTATRAERATCAASAPAPRRGSARRRARTAPTAPVARGMPPRRPRASDLLRGVQPSRRSVGPQFVALSFGSQVSRHLKSCFGANTFLSLETVPCVFGLEQ